MKNPFTSKCPEFLPAPYHSNMRWVLHIVVWAGAMIVWVCLSIAATNLAGAIAIWSGLFPSYVMNTVIILVVVIPFTAWFAQVINQIFLALWCCRTGHSIYLNPLLFVAKRKHTWELHGGQLYDFWQMRRDRKDFSTRIVREMYRDVGWSLLIELIQQERISETDQITFSAHFIDDQWIAGIWDKYRITFDKREPSKTSYAIRFVTIVDIWLKYFLARGKWAKRPRVHNIVRAPIYITTGEQLLRDFAQSEQPSDQDEQQTDYQ